MSDQRSPLVSDPGPTSGTPQAPAPGPVVLGLREGWDSGDRAAHDEGVDLVGSFVGANAFQVVGVPQRRVVQGDAIPAEDGARVAADFDGDPDVVEFAEGDLL